MEPSERCWQLMTEFVETVGFACVGFFSTYLLLWLVWG